MAWEIISCLQKILAASTSKGLVAFSPVLARILTPMDKRDIHIIQLGRWKNARPLTAPPISLIWKISFPGTEAYPCPPPE
jgi:hypothetical protein